MPAADSVAALILVDEREYLLQLRDPKPEIYYPDHWGLFGGAVDPGEEPEAALHRELREELGIESASLSYFSEFRFDLRVIGEPQIYRRFYEVKLRAEEAARLTLSEGRAMGLFTAERLFRLALTPYDSYALWLHHLKNAPAGKAAEPRQGVAIGR